jgi:hypothetical protein
MPRSSALPGAVHQNVLHHEDVAIDSAGIRIQDSPCRPALKKLLVRFHKLVARSCQQGHITKVINYSGFKTFHMTA